MSNIFIDKVKFVSQFNACFGSKEQQNVSCCRASKKMLTDVGFKVVDGTKRVDILKWDISKNLIPAQTYQTGIDLLNKMLDEGKPVVTGVNRSKSDVGNANKSTSHFVVIVGRQFNELRNRIEYRFYDPGTSYPIKGTSIENFFYFDDKGMLVGVTKYSGKKYIVTEVRPTL